MSTMSPSQRDVLLRAICASPSDDLPRLAYADWLEEHDDTARAEFIRVQLELARIDESHERQGALRQREQELLAAHGDAWEKETLAGTTAFALRDMWDVSIWRRGFPARVHVVNFEPFPTEADAFFGRVPAEEVLPMWDYDPEDVEATFGRLIAAPQVRWITGLKTKGRGYALDGLRFWFTSAHAPHLAQIDTHDCDYYGAQVADLIASAKKLTGLRWLDLSGNQIADEGVRLLARARHLAELRTLRLGIDAGDATNDLTPEGLRHLGKSRHLNRLEVLDLDGNEEVGSQGALILAGSPIAASLRDLNLSGCSIRDDGVIGLAVSPRLRGLRRLNLSYNNLSDEAAQVLAGSPYLVNLVCLTLEETDDPSSRPHITARGREVLRQRFGRSVRGLRP
jgi:uncharacterized protein (TIGR02996 family)